MSLRPSAGVVRWSLRIGSAGCVAAALLLGQCGSPSSAPRAATPSRSAARSEAEPTAALAAWNVVYDVLQHPRCANCHPTGDRPLVGDEGRPHPQNVRRGADGTGLYAMRCATCHQTANLADPHLPPGAPNWHLPRADEPLVFRGLPSGNLCRQLRDPARNGRRTPEEILHHLGHDPLVLWGWDPGPGRAPVPTPHAELVRAARTWVESGCDCPE